MTAEQVMALIPPGAGRVVIEGDAPLAADLRASLGVDAGDSPPTGSGTSDSTSPWSPRQPTRDGCSGLR